MKCEKMLINTPFHDKIQIKMLKMYENNVRNQ